jgi:hypothetical protein
MSGKFIVFVGLLAGSGYMLSRTPPPIPPGATAADSAAIAQAGVGARFQYGVGALVCKLIGGTVHRVVDETDTSLKDMRIALKKATGGEGLRAVKTSKRIVQMDSSALFHLEYGHPIKAVRDAMEAKSLVNSVRINLKLDL